MTDVLPKLFWIHYQFIIRLLHISYKKKVCWIMLDKIRIKRVSQAYIFIRWSRLKMNKRGYYNGFSSDFAQIPTLDASASSDS